MFFRALVLEPLRRERLRAAATLLAVALGVALVLAIDLANATAVDSFARSVDVVAHNVNLQILGVGQGFDERLYPRIAERDDVIDAQPIIEDELTIGAKAGDPFSGDVLHVIGADLVHQQHLTGATVAAWQLRDVTEPDPELLINGHGVIIGAKIAQRYHLRIGGMLEALAGDRRVRLPVAAIIPAGVAGVDSSVAFIDIATAQEISGRVGLLDRIDLQVDPARRTQIAAALARALPHGVRVISPESRTGEIQRMLQSFQLNLAALSYVALLVGLFLIYNTVAISVVQRRGDVGILRALGATRSRILWIFLGEGLLFGIVGSVIGLAGGAFLARYSVEAVTKTVDTIYVASHADSVVYSVAPFVKAFALGVVASVLAALAPAREAAATQAAVTMRSRGAERRVVGFSRRAAIAGSLLLAVAYGLSRLPAVDGMPLFGYASGLAIIFGGAGFVPAAISVTAAMLRKPPFSRSATTLLAAGNLGAAQRRNAVAIASLMTAVAMMVAIAVLVGSFRTTITAWANDTLKADLFVRPLGLSDAAYSSRFSPQVARRIAQVKGVASIDTLRAITIPFRGRITTLAAADFAGIAKRNQLRFLGRVDLEKLGRDMPSTNSAVISEPFATRFGVETGDVVTIATPAGDVPLRVLAVYNDYSSDSGFILIDRSRFRRLFHDASINSIAIFAKPGTDLIALRTAVARAVLPARVDVESTRELRSYVIVIFNRTFAITYALYCITIAVAALSVVSTLFALVLERRAEIGVLRYLGLTIGGVRRMILTEAAAIGFLGGVSGVAVGVLLAFLLIYVINRQAFGWLIELEMPWAFLGEAIVLVVIAAVISGIFPASVAARIKTAEATRNE